MLDGMVPWWLALPGMVASWFLGAYFKQKGQNAATLEDTPEIARAEEEARSEVRQQEAAQIHQQQRQVAVAPKQLESLQQAHTLWWNLVNSVYQEDAVILGARDRCAQWFQENSLSLPSKVREAFRLAIDAAPSHAILVETRAEAADRQASWKRIMAPGKLIAEAVRELSGEAEEMD